MSILGNPAIKVAIVEDQNSTREYLNLFLSEIPGLSVVGLATNGKEAVAVVEKCLPDVVLMDIDMPLMNGIEATKVISKRFNHIKVLLLTASQDKQLLGLALAAGAKGYVLKTANSDDLGKIIYLLARGYLQFGPTAIGENYSESGLTVTEATYKIKNSNLLLSTDVHFHKAVLDISQHISEIEKSVEFQQDKIRMLIDENNHRQRHRSFSSQKKSLYPTLDIPIGWIKPKKIYGISSFWLFACGFILGILTTVILIFISAFTC